MSIGSAGSHLGSDPDRFHQFLGRCSRAQRCLGVAIDAVRTMRHVGDGDRNDLLRTYLKIA
jgi:hypothetical protein